MSINIEHLTVNKSSFRDNAAVIRQDAAAPDENAEILQELQRVREQLKNTEPMIADALATLEKAVKAQDKPKVSECLRKFSGETVKAVLTGVASKALLSWMGIA